jgi:hypothetical protein
MLYPAKYQRPHSMLTSICKVPQASYYPRLCPAKYQRPNSIPRSCQTPKDWQYPTLYLAKYTRGLILSYTLQYAVKYCRPHSIHWFILPCSRCLKYLTIFLSDRQRLQNFFENNFVNSHVYTQYVLTYSIVFICSDKKCIYRIRVR